LLPLKHIDKKRVDMQQNKTFTKKGGKDDAISQEINWQREHTYLPHDAQLDGRKKYPGVLCRVLEWQPHPASALKRMLPHAPAG
jgi:hypothetical protein